MKNLKIQIVIAAVAFLGITALAILESLINNLL